MLLDCGMIYMEFFFYDPAQRYGYNLLRYLVGSGSVLAVMLRCEQIFLPEQLPSLRSKMTNILYRLYLSYIIFQSRRTFWA